MMGIAVGGRIDDDQHRFRAMPRPRGIGVRAAILRAEIDGGIVGDAALRESVEFGAAIVRKGDIVADERRVAGIGEHRDGEGGERPVLAREPRPPPRGAAPEPPIGKRRGVGGQ